MSCNSSGSDTAKINHDKNVQEKGKQQQFQIILGCYLRDTVYNNPVQQFSHLERFEEERKKK